jgi:hypothetical protein
VGADVAAAGADVAAAAAGLSVTAASLEASAAIAAAAELAAAAPAATPDGALPPLAEIALPQPLTSVAAVAATAILASRTERDIGGSRR